MRNKIIKKRRFFIRLALLLFLALVFWCGEVYSASVGGYFPEEEQLLFIVEGDFLTEKNIRCQFDNTIDTLDSNRISLILNYGIIERFCLFGRVGIADFDQNDSDEKELLEFESGLVFGGGAKAVFLDIKEWGVKSIISSQFVYYLPEGDRNLKRHDSWDNINAWEWQLSTYLIQDLEFEDFYVERASPYIGIKVSQFRMKEQLTRSIATQGDHGLHSYYNCVDEDQFGLFLGINIGVTSKIHGNVEGRLFDEDAISVSVIFPL